MRRSEWGHAPLREPSGNASKGGGAANGVERRAEPRLTKGKLMRGSLQRLELSLSASLAKKARSLWISLSKALPSSSLVPALVARRDLLVETRTGGAAVWPVVDLRVRTRGAGEGSPAAWEAGTKRDHADGRGEEDSTVHQGSHFSSFLFGLLYACCGALSVK